MADEHTQGQCKERQMHRAVSYCVCDLMVLLLWLRPANLLTEPLLCFCQTGCYYRQLLKTVTHQGDNDLFSINQRPDN